MDDRDQSSPIGRIVGGIAQTARAVQETRRNAALGCCVNCKASIPARAFWVPDRFRPRRQLLCDTCAKGAARGAATVVAKVVQEGLSDIFGEMFAGREKR